MSDRRENSVLFSLRELRSIEDDRVKQEESAEAARIEAERKAREEEIRRAKEAEKRKFEVQQAELQAQLDKASNDAERAKIRERINLNNEAHTKQHAGSGATKSDGRPKVKVNTKTNDPLGGLDL